MHAQNIYKRRYEHKCFACNQKSVTFKVFLTFSDDENFTKKMTAAVYRLYNENGG